MSSTTSRCFASRRSVFLDLVERRLEAFRRDRFDHVGGAGASCSRPSLAFFLDGHGGSALECAGWPDRGFELVEDGPAKNVGQEDVERDRGRVVLPCQRQGDAAALGDDALEALVVGEAEQDARVVRIVLDDQEDRIARLQTVAIIGDLLGLMLLEAGAERGR